MDAPTYPESEVRMLELVFPHMTSHTGALFGGTALALMDKAGYLSASRVALKPVVTVAMDGVEFKVPVRAGQVVELVAHVTRVGRTSLTVAVEMWAEELISRRRQLATSGTFTFVAVDEAGHPVAVTDAASPG